MSRLFVQRFPIYLERVDGKLLEYSSVPKFLRNPLAYDSQYPYCIHTAKGDYGMTIRPRIPTENLLATLDQIGQISHLDHKIPSLLSGQRSALVKSRGKLYRLKAIRSGLKNVISLPFDGTQPSYASEREYEQSELFNEILKQDGIEPLMRVIGFYKFGELSTTISRVFGDTRLDELFYMIESVYREFVEGTENEKRFNELAKALYFDLGLETGRLKHKMNRHNLTWSYSKERTNAHIGNIVIYEKDGKIKIGFVDFDASSDKSEKKQSEIDDQHAYEYLTLNQSLFQLGDLFSSENKYGRSFIPLGSNRTDKIEEYRRSFSSGMGIAPYAPQDHDTDLGKLEELFSMFPIAKESVLKPMTLKNFGDVFMRIDENDVIESLGRMTDINFEAREILKKEKL